MTNERAIERLKERITDNQEKTLQIFLEQDIEAIETVLNLLEKKNRTIQQLKDENRTLNRQAQQYFEQGIKKDKIIDLMAKEISENITNTCPFADYNYDLDCENKCNDNYKECWKQYFENKAKEVQNGKHIS